MGAVHFSSSAPTILVGIFRETVIQVLEKVEHDV